MDDDTLAPFVDALSSALILMVLVSIFFMLQTATSLSSAAKQHSINDIDENKYSPIVYHDVMRANLDEHQFEYLINFKLEKEFIEQIRSQMLEAKKVKIIIHSRDDVKKNTVNLMRLLAYLKLPSEIKVETSMQTTTNVLSTVEWEIN
ncbi:hypothetical protein L3Q72_08380 [Vibrio sp. JC009]|uniref:hypothetical protein n=1 Tax=Vibrio sp. JC009 TaxID=2912314 RepID=UPI0023B04C35|nr:hypothetical protein [Vibrio sp. JC009]WED20666.1 hypothetical protein L3Q72_08380 [Vibrio sp. JC009]